ncbi:acyltransferase family protein [Bacillus sp. USDA818B3_A]|uniref:acyltransferase family protein n=1 Tax=Bacillus sp. USDA818B3_A TaxID=2698834 RepID=UPI00136B1E81|nr:acyltransferase [Bacillus sp. USDA818B3_A]
MEKRYHELDSLRGLAAISVFIGHIYLIFNSSLFSNLLFEFGPFRFLIAGSEAVTLFFVLSGFVLSLPFLANNKKINYLDYVIKRICRIYIPYIAALLFSIVAWEIFYTKKVVSLSNWFNVNWSTKPDFQVIKQHLILIDTFSSNLNNVVWSLVHEMRISLIFPILLAILIKVSYKKGILLAIFLSLISVVYCTILNPTYYGTEIYVSIHCCSMFVIGALLAKYREVIFFRVSFINRKYKKVIFILGIIFYLYAHPSFLLNLIINDFNPFYRSVIDSWFTTIGAALLIILAISSNSVSRVLNNKFINQIGKISYSLYLSHLAVLLGCIHFLNKQLPIWLIVVIAIILTFLVSNIMYYTVEKPSIKLGKYISKTLFRETKIGKSTHKKINIS